MQLSTSGEGETDRLHLTSGKIAVRLRLPEADRFAQWQVELVRVRLRSQSGLAHRRLCRGRMQLHSDRTGRPLPLPSQKRASRYPCPQTRPFAIAGQEAKVDHERVLPDPIASLGCGSAVLLDSRS